MTPYGVGGRKGAFHEQVAYQLFLDPKCETPLVVKPEACFLYDPQRYPYGKAYRGRYEFKRHYYKEVGDLAEAGEEFECAQYMDQLDEFVEFWVRNLHIRPMESFWLQTSTDKFYPDFVCKLKDGRYLVVEYKGGDIRTADDAKEKNDLGELWEKRSGGTCLFVMPSDRDYQAIRRKITA